MNKEKIAATKRTILGKKVKNLRKQGLLPATLYGKKVKSVSLQLDLKSFTKVYAKTGETGLIEVHIEDEKDGRPVLIHNLQQNPVTGQILHVDFYQVDLKEKVKSTIPVTAKGEAPAVSEHKGVLLQLLSEVEVEALPQNLPESLEADVSNLSEVDQTLSVQDLVVDKDKVAILTKQDELIFKIGSLVTKEAEEELKAEEAKAEEAKAEAGTEAPAATEEKKEPEKKIEEKPQAG